MHRHRHNWNLLLALVVFTMVGVAIVPLTTISPGVDAGETENFRDFVYPRLISLADTVDTVESMVAERSRNVLALQAHAEKIERLVEQIDGYLASSTYQGDHVAVVEHYQRGRTAILSAISSARNALRSFDFAGLPDLITQFDYGSSQLNEAVTLLRES